MMHSGVLVNPSAERALTEEADNFDPWEASVVCVRTEATSHGHPMPVGGLWFRVQVVVCAFAF